MCSLNLKRADDHESLLIIYVLIRFEMLEMGWEKIL